MSNYFAMGGYAAFVWPAYGISVGALAAMIGTTLRAYARARARVAVMPDTT
jgi:heme exporter protein CcmD